jgi:hypothetical protein
MKGFFGLLVVVLAMFLLVTLPASATQVLFDGGPPDDVGAGIGSYPYTFAESFVLPVSSQITGITFWTWTRPGYFPSTVSWAISTDWTPGTAFVASGSQVSLSYTNAGPYGIFEQSDASLAVSGLTLAPGTYWLILSDEEATDASGDVLGGLWVAGSNPPATESGYVIFSAFPDPYLKDFQILGEPLVTPEPGMCLLLAFGLAGVGALRRKLM